MCLNKIKSNLWQHLEINWFSFFPLPIVISTNDWRPGHLSGQIYGENEIPIVFLLLFSSHIEATFELWWHDSQPERCCHFKLILRECYRPHGVVKFQVIVNITKPMDYSVGSQSILPPGGGKEMSWRSSSRALLCQANRAVNEGRKKNKNVWVFVNIWFPALWWQILRILELSGCFLCWWKPSAVEGFCWVKNRKQKLFDKSINFQQWFTFRWGLQMRANCLVMMFQAVIDSPRLIRGVLIAVFSPVRNGSLALLLAHGVYADVLA